MFKGLRSHLNSLTLSLTTITYGLNLLLRQNTHIRILEPPLRWLLIFALIALGLGGLLSLAFDKRQLKGRCLVGISATWAVIAYLYAISPVSNDGWVFSLALVAICLSALLRGDDGHG